MGEDGGEDGGVEAHPTDCCGLLCYTQIGTLCDLEAFVRSFSASRIFVCFNYPFNCCPHGFRSNQFASHLPKSEVLSCSIRAFKSCTMIRFKKAKIG